MGNKDLPPFCTFLLRIFSLLRKQTHIGDVVEITTKKGLAYAQYTHTVPKWGALLRVLPGFHSVRPANFREIVTAKEKFFQLFPLKAAVSKGIFEIVANCAVPADASEFPLFRAAGFRDRAGRVRDWWLWDGNKSWKIGKLADAERQLPIQSICNDTLLIERIETGWTPATDKWSQESDADR